MKPCRTHFAALFTLLLLGLAGQASAAGDQITSALAGFDVRYPASLPNDFEIVLYGDGLASASVVDTWDSSVVLDGNGVGWGKASSITPSVGNDPLSPGFGLDCLTIRWAGPPRPDMVGHMVQFGARLRIGAAVAHQELWWTINGQRIQRPESAQVLWHATKNGWLIELNNPNPTPVHVYGTRFFAAAAGVQLPALSQFSTAMNPAQFGAAGWTDLPLPGGVRVLEIPARAHIFLKVPGVPLRPVILQIAGRTVPEAVLPLPTGTTGPNPNDFNGEQGTMTIQTTRATQEFAEDVNGDGAVGISDFNLLRSRFGTVSPDLSGN